MAQTIEQLVYDLSLNVTEVQRSKAEFQQILQEMDRAHDALVQKFSRPLFLNVDTNGMRAVEQSLRRTADAADALTKSAQPAATALEATADATETVADTAQQTQRALHDLAQQSTQASQTQIRNEQDVSDATIAAAEEKLAVILDTNKRIRRAAEDYHVALEREAAALQKVTELQQQHARNRTDGKTGLLFDLSDEIKKAEDDLARFVTKRETEERRLARAIEDEMERTTKSSERLFERLETTALNRTLGVARNDIRLLRDAVVEFSATSIGRFALVGTAVGAVVAAVSLLTYQATKLANEVDTALRPIESRLGAVGAASDRFREDVRLLSDQTGVAQEQVAALFETAADNGILGAAGIRAVADEALRLRTILGGDGVGIAEDLARVLRGFAIDPSQASNASAAIFASAQGVADSKAMLDVMAQLAPAAQRAGIAFETTVAAVRQLVIEGRSLRDASAEIERLAARGDEGRIALEQLGAAGVNYADANDRLARSVEHTTDRMDQFIAFAQNRFRNNMVDIGNSIARSFGGVFESIVTGIANVMPALRGFQTTILEFKAQSAGNTAPTVPAGGSIGGVGGDVDAMLRRIQDASKDLDNASIPALRRWVDELRAASPNAGTLRDEVDQLADRLEQKLNVKLKDAARESERLRNEQERLRTAFRNVADQANDFVQTLGGDRDPMAQLTVRADDLKQRIDDVVAKLHGVDAVLAASQRRTIFDQIDESLERVRAQKVEELGRDLEALFIRINGTAVDDVNRTYAAMSRQVTQLIAQLEALGTEEAKSAAQRARDLLPTIEQERRELEAVTASQLRVADAVRILNAHYQSGDATYRGTTVTIQEYRKAVQDLETEERNLARIVHDGTVSVEARARAEEELKRIRDALRSGSSADVDTAGTARGLRDASASALQLVQHMQGFVTAIGQGNSELGKTLNAVNQIASGINSIAAAATTAGGFGALLQSGSGLASALPAVGLIANGLMTVASSLINPQPSPEELAQAERTKELTASIRALTDRIGDLVAIGLTGDQSRRFSAIRAQRDVLRNAGDGPLGPFEPFPTDDILRRMGTSLAEVRDLFRRLFNAEFDGTWEDFDRLLDGLTAIDFSLLDSSLSGILAKLKLLQQASGDAATPMDGVLQQLEALRQLAPELFAALGDFDLSTPEGIAALRDSIAAIITQALTLDPNSDEAKALFETFGQLDADSFIELFSGLLNGLDDLLPKILTADQQLSKALKEFGDRAAILGIEGTEYVQQLVDIFAAQFPQLEGLLDGIDLDAEGGFEALQERIRNIFNTFNEDGEIDESEQKIIDAFLSILSAAGDVADGVKTVAEQLAEDLQNALRGLGDTDAILGGSAKDRFTRLLERVLPLDEVLNEILGGDLDLSSGGITSLQERLRAYFLQLAEDGITEEEQVIVNIIRQIMASLGDVLDEGDREIQDRIDEQRRNREERRRSAQNRIDFYDLDGEAAFRELLQGYGEAFESLLGAFDLSTPEGIAAAEAAIQSLFEQLEAGGISLEQFEGMTLDEIIEALLELESGLDDLGDAARRVRDEIEDFTGSLDEDYLRATGKDREADIRAAERRRDERLKRAELLGLGPEIIRQILDLFELDLARINEKYAPKAEEAATRGTRTAARASAVTTQISAVGEVTAQSLLQITEAQFLEVRMIRTILQGLSRDAIGSLRAPSVPGVFGAAPAPAFAGNAPVATGSAMLQVGPIYVQFPPGAVVVGTATDIGNALGVQLARDPAFLRMVDSGLNAIGTRKRNAQGLQ